MKNSLSVVAITMLVSSGCYAISTISGQSAAMAAGAGLNATYRLDKFFEGLGTVHETMKFEPSGRVYETATGLADQTTTYEIDGSRIIVGGSSVFTLRHDGSIEGTDTHGKREIWKRS